MNRQQRYDYWDQFGLYKTEWGAIKGSVLAEIMMLTRSIQTDKLKRAITLHKCGYHQIPKHYISPDLTELYVFLYEL